MTAAQALSPPFEVVLCSDVLYEPKVFQDFLTALQHVTVKGTVVYIAYKRRHDDRESGFFRTLERLFDVRVASVKFPSSYFFFFLKYFCIRFLSFRSQALFSHHRLACFVMLI